MRVGRGVSATVEAGIAAHAALPTVHQNAPALIDTHARLPTVHQNAPHLITAHAQQPTVHQNAPQLITTHAQLPTVHQNAPQLITTHARLPTVHQNAPQLITTHAQLPTVHQNAPALIAAQGLTVVETEVYDAAPPTSWTDLDLSGTVGSNATLVFLKVIGRAQVKLAFRKNGDGDEFYEGSIPQHSGLSCAAFNCEDDRHVVVLVATDDTGKIEWMASSATIPPNTVIDVIAYVK